MYRVILLVAFRGIKRHTHGHFFQAIFLSQAPKQTKAGPRSLRRQNLSSKVCPRNESLKG